MDNTARIKSGLQPVEIHHSRHCFDKTPMQTSAACLMCGREIALRARPGRTTHLVKATEQYQRSVKPV